MLDELTRPDSEPNYEGLHQLAFRAMGSSFDLWVAAEAEDAARIALSEARLFIEDAEQVMSRFRDNSDLSDLNRRSGQRSQVVPMLFEAVSVALEAAAGSSGIYDPTILPALIAAGYDRSFDDISASGADNSTSLPEQDLLADRMWSAIKLDRSDHSIMLPVGVQIDLGGIGKAWAAHRSADLLFQTGPCIVSAGGDIAVRGEPYPDEGWFVAVKDPLGSGKPIMTLEVATCGVATSGIDHRSWTLNGVASHHLIDPRTGRPAETDLVSVTVIAPDVLIAERLALTSMILGSEQALDLIENERGSEGLLVFTDGRNVSTSQLDSILAPGGGEV